MVKNKKCKCPLRPKEYQSFNDLEKHGWKIYDKNFDWKYEIIILDR